MTQPPKHPKGEDAWIDHVLDDLARMPVPDAPADLMARIHADAQAMLPAPGGVAQPDPWWRQVVQGLGGWSAVSGLAAAAVTGFVVGLGGLDATGLDAVWPLDSVSYYDGLDTVDAFGWDMEEG